MECASLNRTKSIGVIHSFRPLGGAAAPWLTEFIIQSHPVTPFAIMSVLLGLVGVSSLILPETHDIKLNHDDDDDEDEDEDDNGDCYEVQKSSFDNSTTVVTAANGTVDKNLNKTTETNISVVRKNNNVKLVDVKFDYVGLSQLDRETDIWIYCVVVWNMFYQLEHYFDS